MEKKHRVPDELLGGRYKGKTFWITESGKVYGARGFRLKVTGSEFGLNHPMKMGRNLWWIRGMMFVPNPNNHRHAVKIDRQIHWVSDTAYAKMLKAWAGKTLRVKTKQHIIDEIQLKYHQGMRVSDLAKMYGISRMSIYRFIK